MTFVLNSITIIKTKEINDTQSFNKLSYSNIHRVTNKS